jgi:hypothetical protein
MIAMNNSPGRPEKYGAVHVKIFKEVVRNMGLKKGCEYLRQTGVKINGKLRKLDISQPCLSKYVRRADELTGDAVPLTKGRRALSFVVSSLSDFDAGMTKPKVSSKATKRGPGRSKKALETAVAPKRGPGRPKKALETAVAPKRGPGRPKKALETAVAPKRGPGRPKKVLEATVTPKRGPGRPKKILETAVIAKRGPGRPKKTLVAHAAAGRGPGRPKKTA